MRPVRAHVEAGEGSAPRPSRRDADRDERERHEPRRARAELGEAMCEHEWPPHLSRDVHSSVPPAARSSALPRSPHEELLADLGPTDHGHRVLLDGRERERGAADHDAFGFASGCRGCRRPRRRAGTTGSLRASGRPGCPGGCAGPASASLRPGPPRGARSAAGVSARVTVVLVTGLLSFISTVWPAARTVTSCRITLAIFSLGAGSLGHAHEHVHAAVRQEEAALAHGLVELDRDAALALGDQHGHDAALAGQLREPACLRSAARPRRWSPGPRDLRRPRGSGCAPGRHRSLGPGHELHVLAGDRFGEDMLAAATTICSYWSSSGPGDLTDNAVDERSSPADRERGAHAESAGIADA